MGHHFLLLRIVQTQGSNSCLLLWQADSLPLSNQGIPIRAENTLNVGDHVKSLKPSNVVDGSLKQYNYFENSLAVS